MVEHVKRHRRNRRIAEGGVTCVLDGTARKTRQAHKELFDAFCCAQIERVQRTLYSRYGLGGDRHFLMPGNDNLIAHTLQRNAYRDSPDNQDTYVEVRGNVGYDGPRRLPHS